MKTLQNEIYETWKLWSKDKLNRSFYDTYVSIIVGEYPEQKEYYLTYWESLKQNKEGKKEQ